MKWTHEQRMSYPMRELTLKIIIITKRCRLGEVDCVFVSNLQMINRKPRAVIATSRLAASDVMKNRFRDEKYIYLWKRGYRTKQECIYIYI